MLKTDGVPVEMYLEGCEMDLDSPPRLHLFWRHDRICKEFFFNSCWKPKGTICFHPWGAFLHWLCIDFENYNQTSAIGLSVFFLIIVFETEYTQPNPWIAPLWLS